LLAIVLSHSRPNGRGLLFSSKERTEGGLKSSGRA
jgi:hypothetical protein